MWTGNQFEVDVEFIRHGRTKGNEEKRYISFTDESLSHAGINEINERVSKGYYSTCDALYCSPLTRTKETAQIIYSDRKGIEVEDLAEINFGSFEGKTYLELSNDEAYKKWLDSNCECDIPNGENKADFINRQVLAFKRILKEAKDKEKISIVAHGGTAMAIVSNYSELDYYDCMLGSGEKIDVHVSYEIKGNDDVSISCFGITYRDNP